MNTMNTYQRCNRCIMDTTVTDIKFDENGNCNYCTEYIDSYGRITADKKHRAFKLDQLKKAIKEAGKSNDYDCIVGVSGGLDSSYVLYVVVKQFGLRPLAVHLDNGWNTELSVSNIDKLCKVLGVDLFTCVSEWEEFKKMQLAFFRANVIDIEMLTDHAIQALLYKIAKEKGIKYILAGTNMAHEGMRIPPGWGHVKLDSRNIKSICRKYGQGVRIETFNLMGLMKYLKYLFINRIKWISLLDYLDYSKENAINVLTKSAGWKPYEKKHYESIFTRFYQGYILPWKFGVDKRLMHYSTLICSGQMTRDEALALMQKPTYENQDQLAEDKKYVLKKLGLNDEEFASYLRAHGVPHDYYPSDKWLFEKLVDLKRMLNR